VVQEVIRNDLPRILVIVGPTAVGKSETAVRVAGMLDGEIVSIDSRQIYRGIEIGAGAPSKEQLDAVPHHLISTRPLVPRLTAGDYADLAVRSAREIQARGKLPVLAGGSGLYIRATVEGLAEVPPASEAVRSEIECGIEEHGVERFRAQLAEIDPEYSQLVGPKDRKRLVRALEVYHLTGKPLSSYHQSSPKPWCQSMTVCLDRPRQELHRLIAERIEGMFDAGWIDEVRRLCERFGPVERLPKAAFEAVGVRQIAEYSGNGGDLSRVKERIVFATRQFAKRQLTWFRADKRTEWLMGSGIAAPESWAERIVEMWNSGSISGQHREIS
jgi:tRNA dimethylallyltransferase